MADTKAHIIYKLKDGTRVPSVTSVIGNLGWNRDTLIAWTRKVALAGDDPSKVRDEAASIGTLSHALIQDHILGVKAVDSDQWSPDQMAKAQVGFAAYLDWERQYSVRAIGTELPLVSELLRYGGTIDLVAIVNGRTTVVDFKTSNGVYVEHRIQVAAYQMLYQEKLMDKPDFPETTILQLDKDDGSFSEHPLPDLSAEREIFVHCLALNELHKRVR